MSKVRNGGLWCCGGGLFAFKPLLCFLAVIFFFFFILTIIPNPKNFNPSLALAPFQYLCRYSQTVTSNPTLPPFSSKS
ncbi:hypothetical protein Csa_021457 [Cucumis sativus]|uniref:Uncharacterized protein n=1 Tax=Cucumis sativus TaxID=3659 RepID=A0A0A0KQB2_CUCSA|nr:hypothetical protein Csa_021457 [Cucumis sativus]